MLQAIQLDCVRGDRTLFTDLEFALEPGTLLRVTGPNGSGKTSLLRILCGLAQPAAGEVRWRGEPIRMLREEYWQQLAYVGHAHAVKDELTARENLATTCAIAGASVAEAALETALDRVGLRACAGMPARHLSQGQRRRIALARLAVTHAGLWVLDEPFTALDADATECARELIAAQLTRGGMVVLTSHQEVEIASTVVLTLGLGG